MGLLSFGLLDLHDGLLCQGFQILFVFLDLLDYGGGGQFVDFPLVCLKNFILAVVYQCLDGKFC